LILQETLSMRALAGCLLMLIGILVVQKKDAKEKIL
jgi:drug/metabolite transporter (DMT)-like permease